MFKVKLISSIPNWCRFANSEDLAIHRTFVKDGERVRSVVEIRGKSVCVEEHACEIANIVLGSGALVLCSVVSRGEIWWILLCSQESLKKIMEGFDAMGLSCKLAYKYSLERGVRESLTPREYEILRAAFEMGFFDDPRRITLTDLAATFGVSKSTASEILRRAVKKVVRDYLELYPWFEVIWE